MAEAPDLSSGRAKFELVYDGAKTGNLVTVSVY